MGALDDIIQRLRNTHWEEMTRAEVEAYRLTVQTFISLTPGSRHLLREILAEQLATIAEDRLAERLFDHYLHGAGHDFVLTLDDMRHMNADSSDWIGRIDLRRRSVYSPDDLNPAWNLAILSVQRGAGSVDYSGHLLWGFENGAIANYTIHYSGRISIVARRPQWSGTVRFADEFDMDPIWDWRPNTGQSRSARGERETRIGYILSLGTDFSIVTPNVPAHQTDPPNELILSAPAALPIAPGAEHMAAAASGRGRRVS